MRYLKLNNKNWRRLIRKEISTEQQKMDLDKQLEIKMEDIKDEKTKN